MAAARPPTSSSWSDLPPDLLGLVLLRLPSLADRVHLRAVCPSWRSGARRQQRLPPPQPMLAFRDGSMFDLAGNLVYAMPIPDGTFMYHVVDNLIFLVDNTGGCALMNPLSRSMFLLPELTTAMRRATQRSKVYRGFTGTKAYVKVKLSSPLDSSTEPLVAAILLEGQQVAVSTCKPHGTSCLYPAEVLDWPLQNNHFSDIAFLHGKLYALVRNEGLHILGVGHGDSFIGEKKVSSFECITGDPNHDRDIYYYNTESYLVERYLVESNGVLLMVRRWMGVPRNGRLGDMDKTLGFEVFRADLTTIPGQWMMVNNLSGHALFLNTECSKSVLASQYGGARDDCIYYMHRTFDNPCCAMFHPCEDPLGDSGVYNLRDGSITPLLPETTMAEVQRKRQFLTWFFPADVTS